MKKVQQGFTLIELMIVVAIIGILAAIAIPQYQDYVTRAKWSSNISSIESLKLGIGECVQNNAGSFTSCGSAGTSGLPATLPTPPNATGVVTLSVAASSAVITIVGNTGAGGCTITATSVVATDGNNLTWTYAPAGTPLCTKRQTGFGS